MLMRIVAHLRIQTCFLKYVHNYFFELLLFRFCSLSSRAFTHKKSKGVCCTHSYAPLLTNAQQQLLYSSTSTPKSRTIAYRRKYTACRYYTQFNVLHVGSMTQSEMSRFRLCDDIALRPLHAGRCQWALRMATG